MSFNPNPPQSGGSSAFSSDPQGMARQGRAAILNRDPKSAMIAAMQAAGMNPYAANPFMQKLLGAAEGMSAANAINNVGTSLGDVNARGGSDQMLLDFMTNSLKSGSVFADLTNANAQLPGVQGKLTEIASAINENRANADTAGPYAGILEGLLGAPGNAGRTLASLRAPIVGGKVGEAYAGSLQDYMQSANSRMASDLTPENPSRNFWEYIFGMPTTAPSRAPSAGGNPTGPAGAPGSGDAATATASAISNAPPSGARPPVQSAESWQGPSSEMGLKIMPDGAPGAAPASATNPVSNLSPVGSGDISTQQLLQILAQTAGRGITGTPAGRAVTTAGRAVTNPAGVADEGMQAFLQYIMGLS